jgi:ppGpp synthetase/RelA/SpoT-type nucleotidyltranferase
MPEPESVRQAFARVEPIIADAQRYVRETLEPYARSHNYLFVDRRKRVDSLSEKLESGRYGRWSELDDLYACTIVVPVSRHEDAVVRKLDASFERITVRSRAEAKKAPDVFRFDGLRWYGTLRAEAAMSRQPGVERFMFEVQVITAFEFAWITVTHDLVYKADNVDWRRQRLAAQLKAAVEQIEVIIGVFDSASVAVLESPWPESAAKAEIIERCQLLVSDGLVPASLVPGSWRRFSDNFISLIRSFERDPNKLVIAVRSVLDAIDADLRAATPFTLPVGGTLFQYILSVVARPDTLGDLSRFVVVPSRELTDVYGVRDLPKPFEFDGPAAPLAAPTESEEPVFSRDSTSDSLALERPEETAGRAEGKHLPPRRDGGSRGAS